MICTQTQSCIAIPWNITVQLKTNANVTNVIELETFWPYCSLTENACNLHSNFLNKWKRAIKHRKIVYYQISPTTGSMTMNMSKIQNNTNTIRFGKEYTVHLMHLMYFLQNIRVLSLTSLHYWRWKKLEFASLDKEIMTKAQ